MTRQPTSDLLTAPSTRRWEDDEISVIVHEWCEKMWNEKKLSHLFTPDDERNLVQRIAGTLVTRRYKYWQWNENNE